MKIRLHIKNFLRKYIVLNEYCKKCGRRNKTTWFSATDKVWERVTHQEKNCNVLCWICFNKLANEKHIDLLVVQVRKTRKKK